MGVAVVGGGIVGLFTARHLQKEGADVTLFEPGDLGAGSVHAAGIIEPTTAYRTNTFSFLRRVYRFWRSGTCTFRGVDARWLAESLRQLERPPPDGAEEAIRELSTSSVAEYRALAGERNDFAFAERGLLERFEDPAHFAEERSEALAHRSTVPVEVREDGAAGALFFPEVSWLHTEQFVQRMHAELGGTKVVRRRVHRVGLDGTVSTEQGTERFEGVVVASGVGCRGLGVPLTGLRGYGWHVKARDRVDTSTIFVDRGIALVPFAEELKVTGGWDFDLSTKPGRAAGVLVAVRKVVDLDSILDFKEGSRPCTPDGLPTIGRKERLVVATGGFRLGWSFAPGMGRHAARLALGQAHDDRFLARYCRSLRSGPV